MCKWRLAAKRVSLAAVFGAMILGSEGTLDRANAGGEVLKLATEAAMPPLSYIGKDGRLTGFDVDIGNALCNAMSVTCEWVIEDWDGLIPGLHKYRYDAIIASLPMTDETREEVEFSDRYHLAPASFVGSETLELAAINRDTLAGKIIGVKSGTSHETFLKENFGDIATIQVYDLVAQAALDMVGKRLDLVFGDRISLETSFLKTNEGHGFKLLGPTYIDPKWFGDGAGIAVRKGQATLRLRLNVALKQIRRDGTFKKINDRYFDFDVFGN